MMFLENGNQRKFKLEKQNKKRKQEIGKKGNWKNWTLRKMIFAENGNWGNKKLGKTESGKLMTIYIGKAKKKEYLGGVGQGNGKS